MIEETPAKDIFNVDETGLFYKCTPDKTVTFKGDCCSGGKNSKEPEVTDNPIPTSSEALDHLHQLQRYVEGQANLSESLFQALNMLHEFAVLQRINSTRQLKISNFFKKCE